MVEAISKRPIRLWVAAIMNIVIGLLSLFLLVFLAASPRVPETMRPATATIALAVATASFLVVASSVALLGKNRWNYLMLVAALAFYGLLITQNIVALRGSYAELGQDAGAKLLANVARTGLELVINFWALLSLKTRMYFNSKVAAP